MLGGTAKDAEDQKIGGVTTTGVILPMYDVVIFASNV
jgi:hypothetical protein